MSISLLTGYFGHTKATFTFFYQLRYLYPLHQPCDLKEAVVRGRKRFNLAVNNNTAACYLLVSTVSLLLLPAGSVAASRTVPVNTIV